ncbi:MAG: hypothetical protein NVSMB32_07350 [Actinomycetota bacterium]
MDARPAQHPLAQATGSRPGDQRGFVTIEYVAAIAVSMVLLVVAANFVVSEYGRGVVRAALDQGVRDGARTSIPVATCERSSRQMLQDLLGSGSGSMGAAVTLNCQEVAGTLTAVAQGSFGGWLPAVPSWSFTAKASAAVEPAP